MILGQRIRLRPIEKDDLPRYVKWLADEETRAFVSLHLPYSLCRKSAGNEDNLAAREEQAWPSTCSRQILASGHGSILVLRSVQELTGATATPRPGFSSARGILGTRLRSDALGPWCIGAFTRST